MEDRIERLLLLVECLSRQLDGTASRLAALDQRLRTLTKSSAYGSTREPPSSPSAAVPSMVDERESHVGAGT